MSVQLDRRGRRRGAGCDTGCSRLQIETRLGDSPDTPFEVRGWLQPHFMVLVHQYACDHALHATQMCLSLSADVIAGAPLGQHQTENTAHEQWSST